MFFSLRSNSEPLVVPAFAFTTKTISRIAFLLIKFKAHLSPSPSVSLPRSLIHHSSAGSFHAVFVFGDVTILGRHLSGTFPNRFMRPRKCEGCQAGSGQASSLTPACALAVAVLFVRKRFWFFFNRLSILHNSPCAVLLLCIVWVTQYRSDRPSAQCVWPPDWLEMPTPVHLLQAIHSQLVYVPLPEKLTPGTYSKGGSFSLPVAVGLRTILPS